MPDAPVGAAVTGRLQDLAAALRALGVRVGVGELLAGHRALAAVDAGSREQSFYALRATLCSGRADYDAFGAAFASVFAVGDRWPERDPFEELGTIARAALPRIRVPDGDGEPPAEVKLEPTPAAWSELELTSR